MQTPRQRSLSCILTREEHRALSLKFGDRRLTQEEIAQELGTSRPTVGRIIRNAIAKARTVSRENLIIDLST